MRPPLLKHRIATEDALLGTFVFSRDAAATEICAAAGFDFVIIDLEHALNDLRTAMEHLRAAAASGINALVRLGGATLADAGRLLDAGAEGIVIPHLGLASGSDVLRSLRYHPEGQRPACTGVPAADFGLVEFSRRAADANRDVLAIGLVEDADCVRRLPEILRESRPDWIMPGPSDLAVGLGVPAALRHPRVVEAIDSVFADAAAAGILLGMYVSDPEEIDTWRAKGARFFVYSIDYKILARAMSGAVSACKARLGPLRGRDAGGD
jgi:2-keto-3-deoxy-L-rhamnonate aldolase RhmA